MIKDYIFEIMDEEIEERVAEAVVGFKEIVGNAHEKQEKFVEQIIGDLYKDGDMSKINVVPVRCGFGKSIVIKLFLRGLVKNRTRHEDGDGAIIVTDSIPRLEEIMKFQGLEDMCALIKYTGSKEIRLDVENGEKQMQKQGKYPILLMTSQKYERLNEKEREKLYTWDNGKRKIIIFDEKPFIYNQQIIDITFMSSIKKDIDKIRENEDKQFLISQFRRLVLNLEETSDALARDIEEIIWYKASNESLFESHEIGEKFMVLAEKVLKTDTLYRIKKILDLNKKGALFINKKNNKIENKRFFVLLEDNINKFDTDKIKYWIFDATSDYDVEYYNNIFHIEKIDDSRNESLKIINVKENMSKQAIKEKSGKKIRALNKFIVNRVADGEEVIVATYSNVKGSIEINESSTKLHFGNIKGVNEYREVCKMFHIGLNRQADYYYLGLYMLNNKEIINELNGASDDVSREKLKALTKLKKIKKAQTTMFENEEINEIMIKKIFVDFIQNIFRTKIRDFSNRDQVEIYTFIEDKMEELLTMIEEYFDIKIEHIKATEFAIESVISKKNPKESIAQKIMKWWVGYDWEKELHISEILNLVGITQQQFNKAKENNEKLREFIKSNCGSKRKYYYYNILPLNYLG